MKIYANRRSSSLQRATNVIQQSDPTTAEVLEFLQSRLGWDITNRKVINYAGAVADYVDMQRDYGPYTMEDWYNDTIQNYPEELKQFEDSDDE